MHASILVYDMSLFGLGHYRAELNHMNNYDLALLILKKDIRCILDSQNCV